MKNITISLPTIHCESCVKLINMTLKDIPGIREKRFDIENRKLYLETDVSLSGETVAKAIREDAEYEANLESEENQDEWDSSDDDEASWSDSTQSHPPRAPSNEETPKHEWVALMQWQKWSESNSSMAILSIEWMHCSSCSSLIEKSLHHVSWVQEANVNFASEKAHIKYDPKRVTIGDLEKAVADAGYSAKIQGEGSFSETDKLKKDLTSWFRKFLAGAILSLPMVAFMVYDFVPRLPFERVIMPYSALISLILTTPVLFIIGREYFAGAWSALKMKTFNMFSLISIGTLVAYIYSLYSYFIYIEETGSIICNAWKVFRSEGKRKNFWSHRKTHGTHSENCQSQTRQYCHRYIDWCCRLWRYPGCKTRRPDSCWWRDHGWSLEYRRVDAYGWEYPRREKY